MTTKTIMKRTPGLMCEGKKAQEANFCAERDA